MENIKTIVKTPVFAKLMHMCNGKGYYRIDTIEHSYQLEIDFMTPEWKDVYILPEYKTITLMRWIRKGLHTNDGSLILLK